MNKNRITMGLGILLTVLVFLWGFQRVSYSQSPRVVKLSLVPLSLTNVDDAAGLWQHEGGQVFQNGKQVANYAVYRRVTFGGTDAQNTAAVTMTIFFLGASPPANITLQGSHDFSSGKYVGSVSATSHVLRNLLGFNFGGDTSSGELTLFAP